MDRRRLLVIGLVAAGMLLAGCGQTQAESAVEKPAQVTPIKGTDPTCSGAWAGTAGAGTVAV